MAPHAQRRLAIYASVAAAAVLLFVVSSGGSAPTDNSNTRAPPTGESPSDASTPEASLQAPAGDEPTAAATASAPAVGAAAVITHGDSEPQAAFGVAGGWAELAMPNMVQAMLLQRRARSLAPSAGAPAAGYFTAARDVLLDPKNRFCKRLPAKRQPLRDALNIDIELCFSDVAALNKAQASGQAAPAGCQGLFRLSPAVASKLNVCNASSAAVSSSAWWAGTLRRVVGPLHLRLYLEGPEVVVGATQFDPGACVYYVHFRVLSPGDYNVNFKVLHSDYWGVDETHHRTRHNYNKYMLPRSFPNIVCAWDPVHAKEALPPPPTGATREPKVFPDGTTKRPKPAADLSPRRAAIARLREVTEAAVRKGGAGGLARWVQRPLPVTLFTGRMLRANTYQWLPYATAVVGVPASFAPSYGLAPNSREKQLQLQALTSAAPRFLTHDPPQLLWRKRSDLQTCLRALHKKSGRGAAPLELFISGDSQSRSVHWAVGNYLATVTEFGDDGAGAFGVVRQDGGVSQRQQEASAAYRQQQRGGQDEGKLSFEERGADGKKIRFAESTYFVQEGSQAPLVHTYYKWDSYLDDLATNAAAADVVIAGFGSHPASWGQWSYQKFVERSNAVARTLCREAVTKGKPVIYYGCPSWPKPKLVENFRATNMRLGIFNALAVAAIERECKAQMAASPKYSNVDVAALSIADEAFPVQFVDFFELSQGMLKHSKDGSHYDGTIVAATLAHRMLDVLCPEPPPG